MRHPGSTSPPRRWALWTAAATMAVAAGVGAIATPASAATLTEVTNFGTNPTSLRMYLYIPDNVGPRPAVLVAVHYCTGNAARPASFTLNAVACSVV